MTDPTTQAIQHAYTQSGHETGEPVPTGTDTFSTTIAHARTAFDDATTAFYTLLKDEHRATRQLAIIRTAIQHALYTPEEIAEGQADQPADELLSQLLAMRNSALNIATIGRAAHTAIVQAVADAFHIQPGDVESPVQAIGLLARQAQTMQADADRWAREYVIATDATRAAEARRNELRTVIDDAHTVLDKAGVGSAPLAERIRTLLDGASAQPEPIRDVHAILDELGIPGDASAADRLRALIQEEAEQQNQLAQTIHDMIGQQQRLAHAIIRIAQTAGMADSYWHTDRLVRLALDVLGWTPEQARDHDYSDESDTP